MSHNDAAAMEVLPVLPVHALGPSHHHAEAPPLDEADDVKHHGDLIRSASYTSLAAAPNQPPPDGIKRTFSENVLSGHTHPAGKMTNALHTANAEMFRRASKKAKRRMSTMSAPAHAEIDSTTDDTRSDDADQTKSTSRSVSGTLKSLARRSWIPMTRSASPLRKEDTQDHGRSSSPAKKATVTSKAITVPQPVAKLRPTRTSPAPSNEDLTTFAEPGKQIRNRSPYSKSLKSLRSRNNSVTSFHKLSRQSSATSLRSRSSNEGMYLDVPGRDIPPLPNSASSDQLSGASVDSGRKKDPLWTAFRAIEGEYTAFQTRTSLQKAKTIRTVLIPFLAKHADHPSNQTLRAEDLDRRAHILNRWWAGLLELLNGRSNQSISGTDRPAFLEATIEIMLRPEWRIPLLPRTSSLDATGQAFGMPSAKLTSSIDSDESDFLAESIHQNVRNIFVQNLLSQMAFVVDKLSMRSAPASLVNFGGKTCVYAFFFCPGVADILVRLWHLPPGSLRRIFAEYGVLHSDKLMLHTAKLAAYFPAPVKSLCFSSQTALARHVLPRTQRPPGSEHIRWYGPWVNRWSGRDSDLFFVFAKYYHLMVCEFYPASMTPDESICVPGLAPLHAQMLVVLESTLYRHVGHFTADPYMAGDNVDAVAPLPLTIPNATRSMAENRLVMMLRELAMDLNPATPHVSELVVNSFDLVMKAATKKISMYNNEACFVLCDLVEETFPIFWRYQHAHSLTPVLDWDFWTRVLGQLMQTHTTLNQIRVIALVYSMWTILISNEERKRQLVLDWILAPAFFQQYFNHWSPMVRHYFLRLLCWRVARCDGEASTTLDVEILQTLSARLQHVWAHHQYLLAEAEMRNMSPPSSGPCSPAPGRTLMIIRTDSQVMSPQFSTFDKILSANQNSPYRNHSSALNSMPEADQPQPGHNRKRWSILRNISIFSSTPNSRPGEVTPPTTPDQAARGKKKGTASASNSAPPSRPATPPHQPLCFKYSLEYTSSRPLLPPKNRTLPLPVLPSNAQKLVDDLQVMERVSSESKASAEVKPRKPTAAELNHARYSGRALAEWAQVVAECRNFYTRRKQEGCPRDALVETPAMAVESFRMFS